ncbi:calcium-binding protein [Yoonia sediminilitoris]|uniref:Hemolysin type calcium-binding protein n=1 Tax=Yoonia sediminilitoris TaxID=1286148 RepID=A0A2T6K890_9RHOB|nr:calcium-binding protein [Yoonia sediminilitoris]PUB10904.1 hemolysin type calcium-binding protein [Yoonia sediminilitoris]RCW90579.1 hemolysin type calcium-binding protein [Yoonia sediminilitoris]
MDLTLLLLLGLGLAIAVPIFGGDDDQTEPEAPEQREVEEEDAFGNPGDNIIIGDFQDNVIDGTDGNDAIKGLKGDDTINGGAGIDTLAGGFGNDIVRGGDDRDVITGFDGDDQLFGDAGNDTIQGGAGNDRIDGGLGFDILRGGDDDDVVLGGAAAIRGDGGDLVLDDARGDIARGLDGNDKVYIWGRGGLAVGGEGDDKLVLVTGQGTLEDEDGPTEFFVLANAEDDTILTRATITEFNPFEDVLTLTVDGDPGAGPAPEVEVFAEEQTRTEGDREVRGVFVKAQLVGPDIPGSEEAGAFLRGATLDQLNADNVRVAFTENADYFDPEQTVIDVEEYLLAPRVPPPPAA